MEKRRKIKVKAVTSDKKINKLLTKKPSFIAFALNFHVVSILSLAIKRTEMSKLNPYR